MQTGYIFRILCISTYLISSCNAEFSLKSGNTSYCQEDQFTAECGNNQVILMKSAVYGRMKVGRCARKNYGYMSCQKDVLGYMDKECSGKRTCSLKIFNDELRALTPCPKDISAYLEASYECVDVDSSDPKYSCVPGQHIKLDGPRGYLASTDIQQRQYGGTNCPWHIEVLPGQQINVTLYNFARYRQPLGSKGNSYSTGECYELGDIMDRGGQTERLTLCDHLPRVKLVYTSLSNSVNIQVKTDSALSSYYYLLKYEVHGCPDFSTPSGSHAQRNGDEMTITCNNTKHVLRMHCEDGIWVGDEANCSAPVLQESLVGYDASFPYGVLVVVAIGVALGVFIGGLLLFAVIFYSKRYSKRRQRNVTTTHYVSRRELEIASEDKYLGYTPEPNHRPTYCPAEVVTLQTFPNHAPVHQVTRSKNGSVGSCELEPDITKTTVAYGHAAAPSCTCPMLGTAEPTYSTTCRLPNRPHTYESPACL